MENKTPLTIRGNKNDWDKMRGDTPGFGCVPPIGSLPKQTSGGAVLRLEKQKR